MGIVVLKLAGTIGGWNVTYVTFVMVHRQRAVRVGTEVFSRRLEAAPEVNFLELFMTPCGEVLSLPPMVVERN